MIVFGIRKLSEFGNELNLDFQRLDLADRVTMLVLVLLLFIIITGKTIISFMLS